MRNYLLTSCVFFVFIISSCASSYNSISLEYNYENTSEVDDVKLSYDYYFLEKQYAKKERSNGIQLLAVRIENNSSSEIILGDNLKFFAENGDELLFVEQENVLSQLSQKPVTYLLYLLLFPVNLFTTETDSYGVQRTTSSTPIGIILGPALTLINMLTVISANKKFKTDIENNYLLNKKILKGQTITGLVGVKTRHRHKITILK